ncbi:hypothetical protein BDV95DRAFT_391903 [Massariosphaeria phaeospora]|uniref:CorA-like transporter domain-containing protein n=1 Tax=Massariosphaeria phaeospora TaxID=100035 RepID=A0A7C8ICD7_9PLEO|nr:hypothetical protein BDV95DRAFT_391903 [Massariosphaeria phaeospora]
MKISPYFERTLFHDRSPAADEYYERSSASIFERNPENTKIEVRIQSSCDVSGYEWRTTTTIDTISDEKQEKLKDPQEVARVNRPIVHTWTPDLDEKNGAYPVDKSTTKACDLDADDTWSLSSRASSTALPVALDQHQGGSCPPTYPGPPKLTTVNLDPAYLSKFAKNTKHDFRVFYIRQKHSYSRIQITKEHFEQLLRCCHVFPRFNEYVIGFGSKNSDSEVGPPPLKYRPLCETRGNSYQGFECAYILRYIEFTNRGGGKRPWSLRQFAVYHRYKPYNPKSRTACSTWILVGASQRTEVHLDRYNRSIEDLPDVNPFELHGIFLDTAIASWRPYLVDLTQLVTYESNKTVGILIGSEDEEEDFISIEVEDHQQLKQIEDQIADLILCLDSTSDTVGTFQDMYDQFRANRMHEPLSHEASAYGSDAVVFALKDQAKEVAYIRKKAAALLSKVQNTRTLISSLLERQSGHNINHQISALQALEKQGQDENAIMRELAEKNSRDSSSMRVLTIITMIYLPCTIVSNFYSTQFVNQKELASGGTTLEYSQNAWLFFAISIPLTAFTILIWYSWLNSQRLLDLMLYNGNGDKFELGRKIRISKARRPSIGLPR